MVGKGERAGQSWEASGKGRKKGRIWCSVRNVSDYILTICGHPNLGFHFGFRSCVRQSHLGVSKATL